MIPNHVLSTVYICNIRIYLPIVTFYLTTRHVTRNNCLDWSNSSLVLFHWLVILPEYHDMTIVVFLLFCLLYRFLIELLVQVVIQHFILLLFSFLFNRHFLLLSANSFISYYPSFVTAFDFLSSDKLIRDSPVSPPLSLSLILINSTSHSPSSLDESDGGTPHN